MSIFFCNFTMYLQSIFRSHGTHIKEIVLVFQLFFLKANVFFVIRVKLAIKF